MSITTSFETWHTTTDGVRFKDMDRALAHQAITDAVATIKILLKPTPTSCDFVNGHGYVQQDSKCVSQYKESLLKITMSIPHMKEWMDDQISKGVKLEECHPSWFQRMLDGSHRALEGEWQRMMCINPKSLREWGQPYYANNEPLDQKEVGT